ncbi:MAG: hypothetical protein ABH807_00345 [Candidatus Shapirobacteria bacterium]
MCERKGCGDFSFVNGEGRTWIPVPACGQAGGCPAFSSQTLLAIDRAAGRRAGARLVRRPPPRVGRGIEWRTLRIAQIA